MRIMVDVDMAKVAVERAGEHVRMNLAGYLEKGDSEVGSFYKKDGVCICAIDNEIEIRR